MTNELKHSFSQKDKVKDNGTPGPGPRDSGETQEWRRTRAEPGQLWWLLILLTTINTFKSNPGLPLGTSI